MLRHGIIVDTLKLLVGISKCRPRCTHCVTDKERGQAFGAPLTTVPLTLNAAQMLLKKEGNNTLGSVH